VTYPDFETHLCTRHALLLCTSYEHWTGKQLISGYRQADDLLRTMFDAPFVIVSHGTEEDAIFNFGNRAALELFELSWKDFTLLPSQQSADGENQEGRQQLMQRVKRDGYALDYSGVRISASGRRFRITGASIWNVIDEDDTYHGQAAMFTNWSWLS
jgi:hypothetical protein